MAMGIVGLHGDAVRGDLRLGRRLQVGELALVGMRIAA